MHFYQMSIFWRVSLKLQMGVYLGRWGQWGELDLLHSGSTE